MNRDLDYVLNYMVKYTKDRFMQDSEPMLNSQDIELVLNHIYELEQRIDKAIEYINNNKNKLYQGRNDFTCEIQYSDEVVKANELEDILRGEDNESN